MYAGRLGIVAGAIALAACTRGPEAVTPVTVARGAALVFETQPGWVVETPSSGVRKAQYRLPHAPEDSEDASVAVFFFGGDGGSKEANIERWASQFEQPDGRPSAHVAQNSARKVGGMDVHEVDIAGTYVAETFPGSGQRVRKEGWRMLAAIIETDHGPYYVKLVGPAATVERWEASYRNFVSQLKPQR
jgi:hypothetical protein